MRKKVFLIFCSFIVLTGFLYAGSGCTKQGGKGVLTINITDKPAVYEAVFITFTQVSVHKAQGVDNDTDNDTDNGGDNATNDTNGWIIISNQEQGFDLLQLQNGEFTLLAKAKLAAGDYTQIRLKITDALDANDEPKTYVMVDGEKHPLVVPSGTKSGLKLVHPFTIASDNTTLYLDFDAEKSVNQTGNGAYHLNPTIEVLTSPPQS